MFIDQSGFIHNDGAYILNGQVNGAVANELSGIRWEPGLMRPYYHRDRNGRTDRFVTINTGRMIFNQKTKRLEPERRAVPISAVMNKGIYSPVFNATSLRKDEWIQMDQTVVKAARYRLKAWDDLAKRNTYGGFDGMGKLTIEYEAMSDPGEALIDFSGMSPGRQDSPLFKLRSLPLPIIHSDFYFDARRLAASRNGGSPLDMTMPEAAARRVAETLEQLTIGTLTGPSYGGVTTGPHPHDTSSGTYTSTALGASSVYGYTNFPHRITKTDLHSPDRTHPEYIIEDVLEMKELARLNKFYGPFVLYMSSGYEQFIDDDYFRTGGTTSLQTIRERIKMIDGIEDVRCLDYLSSGYQMILVQMTPEVARAVNGMDITTLQWESQGGMRLNFKVMCIMVPQLRSDYYGQTGIVHGTTS